MLDQSAGPSGHGRRSLEWIQLDDAAHHVIARFTLEALAALVGASPEELVQVYRRSGATESLILRAEEIDAVADIGGVATVTPAPGRSIAVARIGRNSLIGFAAATERGGGIAPVEVRLESV